MKKINVYWLLITGYCLLAVAFGLSLSLFVHRLPDVGQPLVEKELWVYSSHPVSQEIIPQNNGLHVITVYLRNVALRNQDPFLFELSDSSGVIRSIRLTGYNIGDGDNVRFQFNPIMNSKDNPLTLTLTSNSSQKIAIGVGYSDAARSIAYQSFYYPTNRLSILKSTAVNFLHSLFQLRFMIIFVILGLTAYSSFLLIPSRFRTLTSLPKSSNSA
jgi:hypothetical protein